ncbi:hypothetical protein [Bdellovibrio sp. HCB-110]|uniref:hypothetical protein n=1 Tax=Bdellovibrio sp. HCB-110 TaxID=3391182 RepID=UPI0039B4CAE0
MMKIILIFSLFFLGCENARKDTSIITTTQESIPSQKVEAITVKSEPFIKEALHSKSNVCVSNYHCIKYVNLPDTKVKIVEVVVQGTTSMQIKTYDKNGVPIDLEPTYVFEIKGTKMPATIDVELVKKK